MNSAEAGLPKEKSTFNTKAVWKTFWILLCITVVELIIAIIYFETGFINKHLLNGVFIVMTLAKAFFIVAEFMHLGHEIRNLIMSIAIPACLFIWFLIAFVWDGNSYHTLRMRYDKYYNEQSRTKVQKTENREEGKKPGKE
ncbi:MAG TPA: cytochrome C oxidase subunit IV family protein [Puia sp.]